MGQSREISGRRKLEVCIFSGKPQPGTREAWLVRFGRQWLVAGVFYGAAGLLPIDARVELPCRDNLVER